MSAGWNQQRLQQFIDDQVEEGQSLEYKAADALAKTDKSKQEITKDVSAMANSAGGIVIYGIAEHKEEKRKHLPEKLSPINRADFSREWLDQVINNITPRIDGLKIYPVPLDTGEGHVAYVVDIPQSTTAHQAKTLFYHKRYNFEVLPMLDHEIRDVMGRRQNPKIDIVLHWIVKTETRRPLFPSMGEPSIHEVWTMAIYAVNDGRVMAEYVKCFLDIPQMLLDPEQSKNLDLQEQDGVSFCQLQFQNTVRDVVDYTSTGHPKYGPARYNPTLPSLMTRLDEISTVSKESIPDLDRYAIRWVVFADNAPENSGIIKLSDIRFSDKRGEEDE